MGAPASREGEPHSWDAPFIVPTRRDGHVFKKQPVGRGVVLLQRGYGSRSRCPYCLWSGISFRSCWLLLFCVLQEGDKTIFLANIRVLLTNQETDWADQAGEKGRG